MLSSGNGIRRHPLYFLECCMGRNKKLDRHGAGSPGAAVEMGHQQHTGGGGSGKGMGGEGSLKIAAGAWRAGGFLSLGAAACVVRLHVSKHAVKR